MKCKTVLLAIAILILTVVLSLLGAWNMPSDGPVRGEARLLAEKRPGSSTLMERGWDLTHLAERHYGRVSPTILDIILEANPIIKDINKVPVNQEIVMPPITEDSFVLPASDKGYTIHLGTFDHMPVLKAFKDDFALKGKTVEIIVRNISPHKRWYRVVAGPFSTREEAMKTLSALQSRGVSFEFSR